MRANLKKHAEQKRVVPDETDISESIKKAMDTRRKALAGLLSPASVTMSPAAGKENSATNQD